MITVPQKVEEILNKSPFYKRLIAKNLLNISQFARTIKPQIEEELFKDVSEASVVMALKRVANKLRYEEVVDYSKYYGDISLKSGLSEFTFYNSNTLFICIEKLLKNATDHEGKYLTFVKGAWQTTIIISGNLHESLKKIFKNEKIVKDFFNLSSVTVQLQNSYIDEPGVIAYLLDVLAFDGVNVIEVVSTYSELTFIIADSEVEQAFRVINRIKQG